MATDHYKMGYTGFIHGTITEEVMKTQHPMFRSGWRDAQRQQEAKDRPISDLPIEKVVRKDPEECNYQYKWRDVTDACKLGPWSVLEQSARGRKIIVAMRKNIDQHQAEIKGFRDIMAMLRKQWETLLEHGYADGTLTIDDLRQYKYTPKQLRETE